MSETSQVLRVAGHEVRVLSADRTLWLILALLATIAAYGSINGASWVQLQRRTLDAIAAEQGDRLARLEARLGALDRDESGTAGPFDDPRSPALVGSAGGVQHATLPPGPLATLAVGQSDLLPYAVRVAMGPRSSIEGDDEIENPGHLLAGRCDLGFVVVALYPLVILALSYNLLSAEREGGTLSLLLSQPVRLRTVVLGKVLARAAIVVALTAGVALMAGALDPPPGSDDGTAARWACWFAVVLSYGGFWFAAAVAANALGRGSASNALVLASAWLGLVLVVPSLVSLSASSLYPVPSRVELIQATRAAEIRVREQGSRSLARYFEDHPELASPGAGDLDEFALQSYSAQAAVEAEVAPIYDRFEEQLVRQQSLIDLARFLSPAILAQQALEDIAGTGRARHAHFRAQVEEFHRRWRAFFLPRILRKQRLTAPDLAQMPRYAFREEATELVAAQASAAILGILAPAGAIGAVGLLLLRRHPLSG